LDVIVPVPVIAVKSLRNAVDRYTIINITTPIADSSKSEQPFPGMTEHLFPAIILTDSARNKYRLTHGLTAQFNLE